MAQRGAPGNHRPWLCTCFVLQSLLDTDGPLQKQDDRAKSFKTNNNTRCYLARANASPARRSLFANLPHQQAGHQSLLKNRRPSNRANRKD